MRFALVTTFYPPFSFGGDGILVRHLARELAARGHAVDVVHCADSYRTLARRTPATITSDAGVTVHHLQSRAGPLSPIGTHQTGRPVFKTRRVREILGKDFDVIHFHNISLVGGPALLAFGDALKIYTAHDYWLLCPTHVLQRYDGTPCVEQRCLRCQLHHGRPPQPWRYTDAIARGLGHVDICIAPSRFAAERHQRELGRPFVPLPNFVPADDSCVQPPRPAGRRGAEPYALYVGRLERAKGVEELARWFAHRRQEKLLIAGTGRQARRLSELARGTPHVETLGHVPQESLAGLYAGALAVILPSRCYELCPLVALEAFRAGVPVIVRDVGSLPELVEGERGLVYRDGPELDRHLTRLRVEPGLGRALGKRGRKAWETEFSPQVHVTRYLQLIESMRVRPRQATSAS